MTVVCWRAVLSAAVVAGSLLATPAFAAQAPTQIRRFVLVAGSNSGGPGRVPLRYATTDAEAFMRVLEELGGIARSDRLLLLNPSRGQLEGGIERLAELLRAAEQPGTRLEALVYYSGHSDEQGILLGEEMITYKAFRGLLDELPADVRIAVLDSCASGALTRSKGGTRLAPFLLDVSAVVKGHAFLTSTSATEAAQESDRIQGSFFTHYLVSGLRGAADASRDGRVTLTEAYQFAFNETLARTESTQAGPQHPNYDIQLAGSGDLVMTDLRATSSVLVLPDTLRGRVFVRDRAGRLVAELAKTSGNAVELGLEAGDYTITVDDDGQVRRSKLSLSSGQTIPLGDLEDVEPDGQLVALRGTAHSARPAVAPAVPERPDGGEPKNPPPPESSGFSVALLPGLRLPPSGSGTPRISLNLIYGRSPRVDGFELGLINQVDEQMRGVQMGVANLSAALYGTQIGLAANFVYGGGRGAQISPGFNVAVGDFSGVQIGVGFNLASQTGDARLYQLSAGFNVGGNDQKGAQLAGGFNVLSGQGRGVFQAAGGFNVTEEWVRGAQVAGGFNVAGELARGLQWSSGFNYARQLHGAQLSVVNISGDVRGAQIGVLNVALGKVDGLQFGVVNVAAEYEGGAPVGLLSFVRDGQIHVDAWGSNLFASTLSLRLGSENVYTLLSAGYMPRFDDQIARAGVGVGLGAMGYLVGRLYAGADLSWYEADLSFNDVGKIRLFQGQGDHLMQLRVILGYEIFDHLGVFAGVGVNAFMRFDGQSRTNIGELVVSDVRSGAFRGRLWPAFFGGLVL